MKSLAASRRSLVRLARSALGGCLALALVLIPLALASTVTASISGSTVTYSVSGLEPDAKHTVTIQNGTSGSSSQINHTSNPDGQIPSSTGSTGDEIEPGTTVTVTVKDAHDNIVGQTSVTKPETGGGVAKVIKAIIKGIVPFL